MIAHNQDHTNHISEPAPALFPVDPPRSPMTDQGSPSRSPTVPQAGRQMRLRSTIDYNIYSDRVLGSGQFGTVYEAVEEATGNLGNSSLETKEGRGMGDGVEAIFRAFLPNFRDLRI